MPSVSVPGVGDVLFPDTMGSGEISQAIQRNFPHLAPAPPLPRPKPVVAPPLPRRPPGSDISTANSPLAGGMQPVLTQPPPQQPSQPVQTPVAEEAKTRAEDVLRQKLTANDPRLAPLQKQLDADAEDYREGYHTSEAGISSIPNILKNIGVNGGKAIYDMLMAGPQLMSDAANGKIAPGSQEIADRAENVALGVTLGGRAPEGALGVGRGGKVGGVRPPIDPLEAGIGDAARTATGRATPVADTPISRDYLNKQEDNLYQLRKTATADKIQIRQHLESMPPEIADPKMQQKFYDHIEAPYDVPLSPQEQQAFDHFVKPMLDEQAGLYNKIKGEGYDIAEPEYVHRMVKGKTPAYDALDSDANPVFGQPRTLPRTTSSLQNRSMFVAEAEDGTRKVVSGSPKGMQVWNDGVATDVRRPPKAVKPGETFDAGGKTWTIKQARTSEIEAATPLRYHRNAAVNTADNVLKLRRVSRAIDYLDALKKTPEFQGYARPYGDNNVPRNWRTPELPQLRDYKMDPRLANVFDDFYKGARAVKGDLAEKLEKVNHLATGSIFFNPIPHIQNVGSHWYVARGWDNFTPKGFRSMVVDGAKAMKSVLTQDRNYQDVLRHGGAMLYGDVANRDFYQMMLKKMGGEIERDPQRWGPVAKAAGFNKVADFVNSIYNFSAKALWAANDTFMMQRILELERKGYSRAAAIKDAERHIPNYRVPSEVLGSRAMSEIMQDPNLTVFGKYHYGMLKSYGEMVKDIAKGSGKQKLDAAGNLSALGLLVFGLYPLMDKAIQGITGNKDAKAMPRGAATIPLHLQDLAEGQRSLTQVLQGIMTPAPGSQELGEQFFNTDTFTRQPVRTGGPVQQAVEGGLHAAGNLVAPVGIAQQMLSKKDDGGPRRAAESMIGISDPSSRSTSGKRYFQMKDQRDAAKRAQKLKRTYGGFLD